MEESQITGRTVLLASFIDRVNLDFSIQKIQESFSIVSSKIFILKDKAQEDKIILTYNIQVENDQKVQFDQHIPGTISLHRKKESNTLYSINALNFIVEQELGKRDSSHQIDWIKYANCILIMQKNNLVRIETELEKIMNLEKV